MKRDGEDWIAERLRIRNEAPWWLQPAIIVVSLTIAGILMWMEIT